MSNHKHKCYDCNTIWEHSNECKGNVLAHTCPKCGHQQWIEYVSISKFKQRGSKVVAHKKKSVVKRAIRQVVEGKLPLRVVGSQAERFRLAVEVNKGLVVAFGYPFEKQTQAVEFGQKKFGQKAKKVLQKSE